MTVRILQHRWLASVHMLKESSLLRFPISYSELSRNNPTPDSETWRVRGLARFCILLMLGVKPSFRF